MIAATPQPVPIPRVDAVAVTEAATSAIAWDLRTNRWRARSCERRSAIRWDCIGEMDVHLDGWSNCRVRVRVYLRSRRDPGVDGWPRWRVNEPTCAPPGDKATVPVWRP